MEPPPELRARMKETIDHIRFAVTVEKIWNLDPELRQAAWEVLQGRGSMLLLRERSDEIRPASTNWEERFREVWTDSEAVLNTLWDQNTMYAGRGEMKFLVTLVRMRDIVVAREMELINEEMAEPQRIIDMMTLDYIDDLNVKEQDGVLDARAIGIEAREKKKALQEKERKLRNLERDVTEFCDTFLAKTYINQGYFWMDVQAVVKRGRTGSNSVARVRGEREEVAGR